MLKTCKFIALIHLFLHFIFRHGFWNAMLWKGRRWGRYTKNHFKNSSLSWLKISPPKCCFWSVIT